jgi:hypothetical protein
MAPILQELMLVANGNGTVVHVTQKLAALLGRTVQQVLANSTAHALEQLMVEPFSQLHRTLAASIPQTAPPAHSCRSGVSFLMSELSAQGRTRAAPFRMSLKRQMLGDEALHVMCFEKRTLEQVSCQGFQSKVLQRLTMHAGTALLILMSSYLKLPRSCVAPCRQASQRWQPLI